MMVAPPAPQRHVFPLLLLLSLIFGGLNALKPITIDDAAYYYDARQIAAHPLDPYGGWFLWWQEPQPANYILAPPVVPYTWALGLWLFGDNPIACKLLLLPWAFLLIYAFFSLARRFAPGMEWPLTIVTVFSPALWPSFNFMLDLPALSLALFGIELFFRAGTEMSFFKAACAGLSVGIGFETKYTACVAVAAIVLAAGLWRRWALGVATVLVAAHVFCAWEFLTAVLYGRSHFFTQFASGDPGAGNRFLVALQNLVVSKGPLIISLLSQLGGIAPALLLLGLLALGWRRRWLVFTMILFSSGVLAIVLFDSHFEGSITPTRRIFGDHEMPLLEFELADVIFAVFGGVTLLVVGVAAWSLIRSNSREVRRETLFLTGWFMLELIAYFPLTQFPAARRVMGIYVVIALLLGRAAAQRSLGATRRLTLAAIVVFGLFLGFALFTVDSHSSSAQEEGATAAAAWIRANGGGRVYFTGHWGFQYYAEHQGMEALIPAYEQYDDLPQPTHLQPGDWLVVPDERIDQQRFQIDPDYLKEMTQLTFDRTIPLRTISFYGGTVPIQHLEAPLLQVRIYRVQRAFVPQPPSDPKP
jgi:hypothetical protein